MKFSVLFLLTWFVADSSLQARIPRHCLLREEWFTLPQEDLRQLLVAGYNDSELRQAMLQRVQQQTVTLDRIMLVRAISGQRVKVQQIDEFPYPTDFDPAQACQSLAILDVAAISAVLKQPLTPLTPQKQRLPQRPGHDLNGGMGLKTMVTGTTFTVRNVGDTLEFDPIISDDGTTIHLTMASERCEFMGEVTYNDVTQPQFQLRKIFTSIEATTGLPILAGTCSKASRTGRAQAKDDGSVTVSFVTGIVSSLPPVPGVLGIGGPLRKKDLYSPDAFANQSNGSPDNSVVEKLTPTDPSMRLQVELFSLPTSAAAALIDEHLDDPNTRQRLIAMLPQHDVKLEKLLTVRTASGYRTNLQQIAESSYATDFDPPNIPQTITLADPLITEMMRQGGARSTEAAHRPPLDPPNAGFGWVAGLSPTTFTVRNVGENAVFDAVLGDDCVSVDIFASVESLRLVGEVTFKEAIQPIYEMQNLFARALAQVGQPCLLGTMSKPTNTGVHGGNKSDRVWLAFITPILD
jgi:hypothetical protein